MNLTTWAAPAPRLPSLVEAAMASRAPEWRASDMAPERAGRLAAVVRRAKPGHEKWRVAQPRVEALFLAGMSPQRIGLELGITEKTARRALGLIGARAMGVAQARAALRVAKEAADALAVRGGGKRCPTRVGR